MSPTSPTGSGEVRGAAHRGGRRGGCAGRGGSRWCTKKGSSSTAKKVAPCVAVVCTSRLGLEKGRGKVALATQRRGGGWRGCRRCQKRAKIGARRCTGLGGPRTLPKQRTGVKGNIGQAGVREGKELGSRTPRGVERKGRGKASGDAGGADQRPARRRPPHSGRASKPIFPGSSPSVPPTAARGSGREGSTRRTGEGCAWRSSQERARCRVKSDRSAASLVDLDTPLSTSRMSTSTHAPRHIRRP